MKAAARIIWAAIMLGCAASALALAALALCLGWHVWQALTLDFLAPTAAQVLAPGFSLETITALAQGG